MKEILRFAICLFSDKENVVLLKRGNFKRKDEDYSFIGGMIKDDGKAEDLLKIKLQNEIGYIPDDCRFWKEIIYNEKSRDIIYSVYLAGISDRLLNVKCREGEEIIKMNLMDAINSKLYDGDKKVLTEYQSIIFLSSCCNY
jgi:hypothetical protein